MGFKVAKRIFISAIAADEVQHEHRSAWGKNWLADKQISNEEAASIVFHARGQDTPPPTPHHFLPDVEVWVFKPLYKNERWYVKGYWIEDELHLVELFLISFHPSETSS
ncbi:MAG: hypothetical protein WC314_27560 [Vulcanimicrobiota bacterium]